MLKGVTPLSTATVQTINLLLSHFSISQKGKIKIKVCVEVKLSDREHPDIHLFAGQYSPSFHAGAKGEKVNLCQLRNLMNVRIWCLTMCTYCMYIARYL